MVERDEFEKQVSEENLSRISAILFIRCAWQTWQRQKLMSRLSRQFDRNDIFTKAAFFLIDIALSIKIASFYSSLSVLVELSVLL